MFPYFFSLSVQFDALNTKEDKISFWLNFGRYNMPNLKLGPLRCKNHLCTLIADNDKIAADYWTGGNDIEKEGSFKWLATDQPFVYTNWMIHQPDPAEQDCVEIRGVSNFKWHDDNCEHQHRFICEKP